MEKPNIKIENIDIRVIYVRFKGSYVDFRKNSRKLFNQLFKFAKERDLIIENVTKVLTIYQDNPFITDEKNLRTSVAMTIPKDVEINEIEEINVMTINGKYGVGHFEISAKEYGEAWNYMYNQWLFKEKVKPRDTFPFELYVTEPPKNMKDKSFTDIYIPIE
ncbi:AraC family transcriptional regulator [Clostridium intestinale]|uniref:GyrI-like domain-containing protein n=1 Tax=Clostridium intestinale TaxID=36845 RepID=A0A7D6VUC1_9CLOT|nr:GyrI-like domain-containing protein [Clostridium intestinale]QLY81257.1 GyrI-like domain-containing protein [Clostridium intestinale]